MRREDRCSMDVLARPVGGPWDLRALAGLGCESVYGSDRDGTGRERGEEMEKREGEVRRKKEKEGEGRRGKQRGEGRRGKEREREGMKRGEKREGTKRGEEKKRTGAR